MLSLIQRVTSATVSVEGEVIGTIEAGLLALVGMEPGDGEAQIARMAERLLGYRVFADEAGRMNRSLADTGGGLLLVLVSALYSARWRSWLSRRASKMLVVSVMLGCAVVWRAARGLT